MTAPPPPLPVPRSGAQAALAWALLVALLLVLPRLAAPQRPATPAASPDAPAGRDARLSGTRRLVDVGVGQPASLVGPEAARQRNASVPLQTDEAEPAPPFAFSGDALSRARAVDCLAAAAWYEAGDDMPGQRAVAQVVLNRVRHPAFAKSVCGVVFSGAERATGCQFTFTCDGSLRRRPSPAAWERARMVARAALDGAVDWAIGSATHYHTDWVYPYWSAQLTKIARRGTHLFFRWPGAWGAAALLRAGANGPEPAIARIAGLSPAHASTPPDGTTEAMALSADTPADARAVLATRPDGAAMIVALGSAGPPDGFPALARALCGARARCQVLGWTDAAAAPRAFPVPETALAGMAFGYLRDSTAGFERALWNCRRLPRANPRECMRERAPAAADAPGRGQPPRDRARPAS